MWEQCLRATGHRIAGIQATENSSEVPGGAVVSSHSLKQ